jgi:hypothetical protein
MAMKVEFQRKVEHETERKTPKGKTEIRMGKCHTGGRKKFMMRGR